MNKKLILITSACLAFGLGAMTVAQDVGDTGQTARQGDIGFVSDAEDNHWICEPLLLYDVSGHTLVGDAHKSLIVLNNGRTSFAEFGPGVEPRNVSKVLPVHQVEQLHAWLVNLGAHTMTDQPIGIPDMPMSMVSISWGETDAKCHTFNFWSGSDDYMDVEHAIEWFIQTNFPDSRR